MPQDGSEHGKGETLIGLFDAVMGPKFLANRSVQRNGIFHPYEGGRNGLLSDPCHTPENRRYPALGIDGESFIRLPSLSILIYCTYQDRVSNL